MRDLMTLWRESYKKSAYTSRYSERENNNRFLRQHNRFYSNMEFEGFEYTHGRGGIRTGAWLVSQFGITGMGLGRSFELLA